MACYTINLERIDGLFLTKKTRSDFVVLLSTTFTDSLHQNRRIHYTHNLRWDNLLCYEKFMVCVISHHVTVVTIST